MVLKHQKIKASQARWPTLLSQHRGADQEFKATLSNCMSLKPASVSNKETKRGKNVVLFSSGLEMAWSGQERTGEEAWLAATDSLTS